VETESDGLVVEHSRRGRDRSWLREGDVDFVHRGALHSPYCSLLDTIYEHMSVARGSFWYVKSPGVFTLVETPVCNVLNSLVQSTFIVIYPDLGAIPY